MQNLSKNCPSCNTEMKYKIKSTLDKSIKEDWLCRSCSAKNAYYKFPGRGWTNINNDVKSGKRLNGFAGKKHTNESRIKMSNSDKTYTKTEDFRNKISNVTRGENNPVYGKSLYSIWLEKYGEEIADQKLSEFRSKISLTTSGKKNPMYGKQTPVGSGNGWSGWYKGWFFRSILELSYMIKVIERFNLNWHSAESNKYVIKYVSHEGADRTYKADFVILDKYLVEIKPKGLQKSKSVSLKKEAAKEWCEANGLIYKLTSCSKLTDLELKELIESNLIRLTNRYKLKYNEKFK